MHYFEYKGIKYAAGTRLKYKSSTYGIQTYTFNGAEYCSEFIPDDERVQKVLSYRARTDCIVEIIEPVFYDEKNQKKSEKFQNDNSDMTIETAFLFYVIIMVVGTVFKIKWVVWVLTTIGFAIWRAWFLLKKKR